MLAWREKSLTEVQVHMILRECGMGCGDSWQPSCWNMYFRGKPDTPDTSWWCWEYASRCIFKHREHVIVNNKTYRRWSRVWKEAAAVFPMAHGAWSKSFVFQGIFKPPGRQCWPCSLSSVSEKSMPRISVSHWSTKSSRQRSFCRIIPSFFQCVSRALHCGKDLSLRACRNKAPSPLLSHMTKPSEANSFQGLIRSAHNDGD